ncbi:MAG: HEAT repeat domain-containing protein [Okeania sp. SIO2F4]|uniref:HEAT repeat domain-containing protein n=1 Tax=Okeania sp. SIO2F4 TaxID=2607790 RepID=UPI001428D99A|nr:HEAT repeat domain-containing protein [Okeania sp. SIO2F4]NES02064.1 HEAT repeat domain-containing protein [Okeania sp. SIO2F4]
MSNLLEQAKIAAQQQNWSLVSSYLQKFISESKSKKTTSTFQNDNVDLDAVIDLGIEVLENGDFQEKWDIDKLFKQIGKPAISPLIEILKDREIDLEERWFVTRILAKFNSEEVLEVMGNIIVSSEAEDLQEIAADTLANFGELGIDILTDLLARPESRLLATKALAKINCISIITPLLTVVKDENNDVRIAAISALTNYSDSRIPIVLISALKDTVAKVRKAAIIGLAGYANLQKELGLVKLLQPLLWDINFEVSQQAAIAMGKIGTNSAATALFELLKTATVPFFLKIDAVRALGWIETQVSLEYLQNLLGYNFLVEGDDREQIVNEIIRVLGNLEKPELKPLATDILIEFIASNNPSLESGCVKKSLALALGYLGNIHALDYLIQLLEDEDNSVRFHSVAAMKQLDGEKAYQKLISLSQEETLNSQLKTGIAIAIAEMNKFNKI